jgi:hypothetical protein
MKKKIIGFILLLTGAIQINAKSELEHLIQERDQLKQLQEMIPLKTIDCVNLSIDVADRQFPTHLETFKEIKDWVKQRVKDNCKLGESKKDELKEQLNQILWNLQRAEKNKDNKSTLDNDSSETTEGLKADIIAEVGDYVVIKKPQNVKWTTKVSNFFRNLFGRKDK